MLCHFKSPLRFGSATLLRTIETSSPPSSAHGGMSPSSPALGAFDSHLRIVSSDSITLTEDTDVGDALVFVIGLKERNKWVLSNLSRIPSSHALHGDMLISRGDTFSRSRC
eukprot:4424477-Pyramimonas_sp.AAC.1